MTRFDQRPERGFSGEISEEGALGVGEFGLVSLKTLVSEIRNSTTQLAAAGSVYELDLKAACDVVTLEIYLEDMERELGRRDPAEVARETQGMEFRQRFQTAKVTEEVTERNFKI